MKRHAKSGQKWALQFPESYQSSIMDTGRKRYRNPAKHGFIIKKCLEKRPYNTLSKDHIDCETTSKYFISLKYKKCYLRWSGLYPVIRSDAVRQLLVIWVWCWQHNNYNAGAIPHSHTNGWWIGDVIGRDRTWPCHLIGQDSRVQARRSKPLLAKLIASSTAAVRVHGTLNRTEI